MNTATETGKPSKCPRCDLEFPDDKIRWNSNNINKHIKVCEAKYLEQEKIKNSKKSIKNFFRKYEKINRSFKIKK
jgi:hypothetical protein